MKVFWSWQSDTPGKIGRFLVRDALKAAIDRLKQPPDIEEPTTKESREALHIDQDIQGITGSPDLARTIFDKIDASKVVVADVTLVGNVPAAAGADGQPVAGKKLINSNVAIELGYALRALTDRNVLLVFNEHFGTHEDLPFDLRHKGGSVVFNLPPNADKTRIGEERKKLEDRLVVALRPYVQRTAVPSVSFTETRSTFSKAAYFQKGEVIASIGTPGLDEIAYSFATESLCYLRVIPVSPLPELIPLAKLATVAQRVPLLKEINVVAVCNEYGAIGYTPGSYPQNGPAKLNASTQLFENGELWSVCSSLIKNHRGEMPEWVKLPALPVLLFERAYYDALHSLIRFADAHLGLKSPWQVELGVVGIKGLHVYGLAAGMNANTPAGPIRKPEIIYRLVLNDPNQSSVDQLLLAFFTRVYDATGQARPKQLFGFPPNRPA